MMIHYTHFKITLLACFSLSLFYTGMINTACAAQKVTKDKAVQNDHRIISGKVTDVISASGFTYAEIDTGKEKVWTAGPGVTPLKKGDMVKFSTQMPMYNYHSKTLGRDFSLIYFIRQYITDNETSTITTTNTGTPAEVWIGSYLRDVTMTGINGKNKKLSDFKGKPLIINVWASWCGPCRAEMGSLQRLANRYNGKELNVIGISTDDYHNKAVSFIKQTGITFESFLDSKLVLENMLGANTIPLTVLVDENGRVLEKVRGSREWDNPEIIDAIGEVFHIKLVHQSQ